MDAVLARSTFRSQKCKPADGFGPLSGVQMSFCVAGAKNVHLVKSEQISQKRWQREGFAAFPETTAGVGHLKRIFKDAFRVAGAVQKTCSSEMFGGQGAHFLRGAAFWSIRSSEMILRDRCSTSYDLASIFRGGAIL